MKYEIERHLTDSPHIPGREEVVSKYRKDQRGFKLFTHPRSMESLHTCTRRKMTVQYKIIAGVYLKTAPTLNVG